MVLRRGDQARDDQLPHAQAGEGRALLRAHLRSDQGLGVLLRQVQARPLQGHRLRQVRRRGDALARSAASAWATSSSPARSATSGSSRARRAGSACCSTSPRATSSASSTSPCTSSRTSTRTPASAPCAAIEDEAEGRGGKSGQRLTELEDELKAELNRKKDELNADLAATKADLEAQRAARTEEIVAAAKDARDGPRRAEVRRRRGDHRLRPDGRGRCVAAGDKGGKEATARLRKMVGAVDRAASTASCSSARPTRPARPSRRIDDLRAAIDDDAQAEREGRSRRARPRASRTSCASCATSSSPSSRCRRSARPSIRALDEQLRLGRQGRPRLRRRHGRRGGPRDHQPDRPRGAARAAPGRDPDQLRPAAQEGHQAAARRRVVPQVRQPPGVDDPVRCCR